jgi:hypothetical protein
MIELEVFERENLHNQNRKRHLYEAALAGARFAFATRERRPACQSRVGLYAASSTRNTRRSMSCSCVTGTSFVKHTTTNAGSGAPGIPSVTARSSLLAAGGRAVWTIAHEIAIYVGDRLE